MEKKPRVAMFFSSDPSSCGGVQEHVYNLGKTLFKRGYKVDTFGPENNKLDYVNYCSVGKVVLVPLPNGNWANMLMGGKEIDRLVRRINKNYDLFHIHEPYTPFVAYKLVKEVEIVKVATFHTAWEDGSILNVINPIIPLFKELFSKYVKGAIFVSEIGKRRWEKMCGGKVIKKVIGNGVDLELFWPEEKRKERRVKLIFAARVVSRKGLILLLEAIEGLRKEVRNFELVVLGDGSKLRKAKEYVKKKGLSELVSFKGEIIGEKRGKYFREGDIFCAPYTDEGFPLAIIEAMGCGLTIVGFKFGVFESCLKDYPGIKLLAKYKDIEGLKKGLRRAVNDEGLRKKIMNWGVRKARNYSWEKVADKIERTYEQVLEKGG